MTTLDVLERYYVLLAARDLDGLTHLLHPEISVTYHAQEAHLPWAGTFVGHDGFAEFLRRVAEHVEIVDADRLDPIVDGNKAVVETQGTWRAIATGRLITGGMLNIFTITDGRISGYEVYADTGAFHSALSSGLPPDIATPPL